MVAFIDITGRRFGRLVAVYINGKDKHKRITWHCACDCGGAKTVAGQALRAGSNTSCGCAIATRSIKHGDHKSQLYGVWCGMKHRCSPEHGHARYAGRGIKVCPEWATDYLRFKAWSEANGYRKGLEIDRIDNDGNYEPSNCRWVTSTVNKANRSISKWVEYKGQRMTLTDLVALTGIPNSTLRARILKRGMTADQAVALGSTGKSYTPRYVKYEGMPIRMAHLAKQSGISVSTLIWRIDKLGMTPEQAVSTTHNTKKVIWRGRSMTLADLAKETGVPKTTLVGRIQRQGMDVEQAVTLPRDTWSTRRLSR